MIKAAFVLFRAPSGRVLLLQRAKAEDHGGEWSLPGGKIRANESAEQAAIREVYEECAYRCGHVGKLHTRRVKDGVDALTFLPDCEEEWQPKLNKEHLNFLWLDPQDALAMGGVDG
jgi:8-oxo-dGTP pyrophosphatase MutT (NUDIX family)